MALACPQCKQLFEQNGVCPLCNVVVLYHAPDLPGDPPSSHTSVEDDSTQWQQTPWGKILIGLILAQGLSFGLLQMLTAGFLASGDGVDAWHTLWGIVARHAIHAVSLILGGALTGAGQRRGIIYGALVGFTSGAISFVIQGHSNGAFSSVLVYAEPMLHLAIGAIGGALGMLIWRPTPTLPELEGSTPPPNAPPNWGFAFGDVLAGPVHVGRVCAGAFVIVIGVVWAKAILEFLLRASNGNLAITSQLQAQLVSMEISALVAILGAAFAGATTKNGLKQGLCVGIAASAIVLGIQIASPRFVLESAIFTISGIIIVALVGGWFGGQLFPPISSGRRRRSFSYNS
jgi:hypothetical protein